MLLSDKVPFSPPVPALSNVVIVGPPPPTVLIPAVTNVVVEKLLIEEVISFKDKVLPPISWGITSILLIIKLYWVSSNVGLS